MKKQPISILFKYWGQYGITDFLFEKYVCSETDGSQVKTKNVYNPMQMFTGNEVIKQSIQYAKNGTPCEIIFKDTKNDNKMELDKNALDRYITSIPDESDFEHWCDAVMDELVEFDDEKINIDSELQKLYGDGLAPIMAASIIQKMVNIKNEISENVTIGNGYGHSFNVKLNEYSDIIKTRLKFINSENFSTFKESGKLDMAIQSLFDSGHTTEKAIDIIQSFIDNLKNQQQ